MTENKQSPELEAFKRTLEVYGLDKTLTGDENIGATLVRTYQPQNTIEILRSLPRMKMEVAGGSTPDLTIQGTLGEGGMGVVLLASQHPLDRLVAVKSTHDKHSDRAMEGLLQEAYITGMVEHPNVVPIYTVGRDEKNKPIIVMKRIEGTSWQVVLDDPRRGPKGIEIDLGWHLKILIEVADAVRFAHSRGIIHRDIKPENVMIGNFGEVYLLDWGIALSMGEDTNPLIANRTNAPGIAGTPSFMAPELTDNTAENVDVRTDVYLLGATLHVIITGQPRHTGANAMQSLLNARQSKPVDYGSEVPEELAAIANKATAANKADRFVDVAAFQAALHDFLEHRASLLLSGQAQAVWDDLKPLLTMDRGEAEDLLLHERLSECRFGFKEALTLWPENREARIGLQACLEALVAFYIAIKNDVGALAAANQFLEPNPQVDAQVRQLAEQREAERREVAHLKNFQSALDLKKGASTRSLVALALGTFWAWSSFHYQAQLRAGTIDNPILDHLMVTPRTVGIAALAMIIFRKPLFSNIANRRLMFVLISGLLAVTCGRVVTYQLQTDIVTAQALEGFLWAFAATMTGVVSDWRIMIASAPFYVAVFLGIWMPSHQLDFVGVANALFFLALAFIWRPRAVK